MNKTQDEKDAEQLRESGRASFRSLVSLFPLPFELRYDVRQTIEALPMLTLTSPGVPTAPWRFGSVIEETGSLNLEYNAEPKWVEFYLGFLEALVDFCNQTAFILVKALRNKLHFRLVLAEITT